MCEVFLKNLMYNDQTYHLYDAKNRDTLFHPSKLE